MKIQNIVAAFTVILSVSVARASEPELLPTYWNSDDVSTVSFNGAGEVSQDWVEQFCDCGPVFFAGADLMYLKYFKSGGVGAPAGGVLGDFDYKPAWRINTGVAVRDGWFIEGRYMNYSGNTTNTTPIAGNLSADFYNVDAVGGCILDWAYGLTTRLEGGVRHFEFDERIAAAAVNGTNVQRGTGLILGVQVDKTLFNGVSLYGKALGGSLFGGGAQTLFNFTRPHSDTSVNVLEYGVGISAERLLFNDVVLTGSLGRRIRNVLRSRS